jgi:hypothetical protein
MNFAELTFAQAESKAKKLVFTCCDVEPAILCIDPLTLA